MSDFAQNKKARFNYEILEEFEAGIELVGMEVKSIRNGGMNLEGAHVTVRGGEAFIINANIAPYQPKNTPETYDPLQLRRLLLKKEEISRLAEIESKKGLTIVPISVYNKKNRIKVLIGIARGKKQFDKRDTIKRREADKDIARTLKTLE
jgi:SsrA-binding protein